MSKRTLRTPDDYGGNVMNFLLSEYAWAEWLDINGANGGPSTGFARSLVNNRYDAGKSLSCFSCHYRMNPWASCGRIMSYNLMRILERHC